MLLGCLAGPGWRLRVLLGFFGSAGMEAIGASGLLLFFVLGWHALMDPLFGPFLTLFLTILGSFFDPILCLVLDPPPLLFFLPGPTLDQIVNQGTFEPFRFDYFKTTWGRAIAKK